MTKLKKPIPLFKTEEEEAEFWDTHSPLDYFEDITLEKVVVQKRLDYILSIRLNRETKIRLFEASRKEQTSPSIFVRRCIERALRE